MKEFWGKGFDLVSLDIEGLEDVVLKKWNFLKFRPKVMCLETLKVDGKGKEVKNSSLIRHINSNNYLIYADTYVNTIFVDKACFDR